MHRPTVFLNLDPSGMTVPNKAAGLEATLAEERSTDMKKLSLIQQQSDEVSAVLSLEVFIKLIRCSLGRCYCPLGSFHS